jgi:hypothetical protein
MRIDATPPESNTSRLRRAFGVRPAVPSRTRPPRSGRRARRTPQVHGRPRTAVRHRSVVAGCSSPPLAGSRSHPYIAQADEVVNASQSSRDRAAVSWTPIRGLLAAHLDRATVGCDEALRGREPESSSSNRSTTGARARLRAAHERRQFTVAKRGELGASYEHAACSRERLRRLLLQALDAARGPNGMRSLPNLVHPVRPGGATPGESLPFNVV